MKEIDDPRWYPWQLSLVQPSIEALGQEDQEAVRGAIDVLQVDPYDPPGYNTRPLGKPKRRQRWLLTLPSGVRIVYEPIPGGLPPSFMKRTIIFWSISSVQLAEPTASPCDRDEES
jgi:hypothetical protein